jgi:hypothetical protein
MNHLLGDLRHDLQHRASATEFAFMEILQELKLFIPASSLARLRIRLRDKHHALPGGDAR